MISVDFLPKLGGVSLMAHHVANSMVSNGNDVLMLAPKGACTPKDYVRLYGLIEDFQSQTRLREGAASIAEEKRLVTLIEQICRHHDVTDIVCMHPFYYAWPAVEVARKLNIACGVYFHGFEFFSQLLRVGTFKQPPAVQDMTQLPWKVYACVRDSSRIFVNSSYTKTLIQQATGRGDIVATGCGLENEIIDRYADRRPNLLQSSCETIRFAYVGRLVKSKRVDRLILWCAKSPRFSATIIGDGPERESLVSLVAQHGLDGRVKFAGSVTEQEKYQILEQTDFIALLSEENHETGNVEGFGIALIEGAAAGAIPFSSGTGGMVDIVRHGDTGFVQDALVDAQELVQFCSDRPRIEAMGNRLKTDLADRFNWNKIAQTVLDVI